MSDGGAPGLGRPPDPSAPGGDDLVTLAHFESLGAAEAARGLLESGGIPALVLGQDVVRLDPFRPRVRPRIRLQVRAGDEAAARELLDALESPEPAG